MFPGGGLSCLPSYCTFVVQFEISPEDTAERTFTGSTPSECHKQLLEAINESRYVCVLSMYLCHLCCIF